MISLYDIVKRFDSHRLFRIAGALEYIVHNCVENRALGNEQVHDENKRSLLTHLDSALELITDLPLNSSLKQVERIKTVLATASVFHLMRVVELAVQQLGKRLKVSLVTEKNWQNILDEVNKAIRNLPAKTAKQKAVRDSYSAASAHLQNVKEAWRNRVMHPKASYTENEAEEIFNHVKALMRHLAKIM